MNTDPNNQQQQEKKQPEDGTREDLNLTNSDASLANKTYKQADTSLVSDNATTATSDNFTKSVMNGSELNPEYGDAADPALETI